VFAQSIWNSAGSGALDGNWGQVWIQVQTIVVAGAYSAVATGGLLWIIGRFAPLRASPEEESLGMDVTQHGEEAYGSGEGAILVIEEERGTRK
jgi:Amt family ammonium transporter